MQNSAAPTPEKQSPRWLCPFVPDRPSRHVALLPQLSELSAPITRPTSLIQTSAKLTFLKIKACTSTFTPFQFWWYISVSHTIYLSCTKGEVFLDHLEKSNQLLRDNPRILCSAVSRVPSCSSRYLVTNIAHAWYYWFRLVQPWSSSKQIRGSEITLSVPRTTDNLWKHQRSADFCKEGGNMPKSDQLSCVVSPTLSRVTKDMEVMWVKSF